MQNQIWDYIIKILVPLVPLCVTAYGIAVKYFDSSVLKAKEQSTGIELIKKNTKEIEFIERDILQNEAAIKENSRRIDNLEDRIEIVRESQAKNVDNIMSALINGTKRQ